MEKIFANHASCKWLNHYERLIERGRSRSISEGEYYERHHIVPKCISGTDDLENLVSLTPEEHYTAHLILCKLFPNNGKLYRAVAMMTVDSPSAPRNNKMYGWIKRKLSIHNSKRMKEWHKNNTHPMLGRKQSAEARQKIKDSFKNKPKKLAHYYSPATGEYLGTCNSVKEAAEKFDIHHQTIFSCIRIPGKRTAGGYFWSYEKVLNIGATSKFINGKPSLRLGKSLAPDIPRRDMFYSSKVKSDDEVKRCWVLADEISKNLDVLPQFTQNNKLRISPTRNIAKRIKQGWNPTLDPEWLTWKEANK